MCWPAPPLASRPRSCVATGYPKETGTTVHDQPRVGWTVVLRRQPTRVVDTRRRAPLIISVGGGQHRRKPGLAAGWPTIGGKLKVDWKRVGAAGSVIGGIAVMHGLKTRKWRSIHSFGVALGIAATVVPLVERARRMSATYA